jgi:hypothetical protein
VVHRDDLPRDPAEALERGELAELARETPPDFYRRYPVVPLPLGRFELRDGARDFEHVATLQARQSFRALRLMCNSWPLFFLEGVEISLTLPSGWKLPPIDVNMFTPVSFAPPTFAGSDDELTAKQGEQIRLVVHDRKPSRWPGYWSNLAGPNWFPTLNVLLMGRLQ